MACPTCTDCAFLNVIKEKDRTDEIKAVVESYPGTPFEFIPLRLEDAFDPLWWKQVAGDLSTSALSLGLDMRNEGKSYTNNIRYMFTRLYPNS